MMYDEHRRDTDGRGVPDVETHIGKTCGDDLACAIELMYEARALIGAVELSGKRDELARVEARLAEERVKPTTEDRARQLQEEIAALEG